MTFQPSCSARSPGRPGALVNTGVYIIQGGLQGCILFRGVYHCKFPSNTVLSVIVVCTMFYTCSAHLCSCKNLAAPLPDFGHLMGARSVKFPLLNKKQYIRQIFFENYIYDSPILIRWVHFKVHYPLHWKFWMFEIPQIFPPGSLVLAFQASECEIACLHRHGQNRQEWPTLNGRKWEKLPKSVKKRAEWHIFV